jgi:hypothetical protein
MSAIDPIPPVVAPAPPAKNSFQRMAGALFAPAETFADIARRPDILVPLLVLLVIGYVTTFVAMPRLDFDATLAQQTEMMKKQNPNMSDADIERMGRITKASMKVMMYIGPMLMIAWYAVLAVVLFGAFRLMGGDGTYKQSLSATLYAWMPLLIFSIISTIVLVARGSVDPAAMPTIVKSNPAFLVDMKTNPVLFSLLSSFDIFTIWTIVLLVFGFSALSKFSKAKSAAIILTLWVVMLVVKLGFAALGAARMNA